MSCEDEKEQKADDDEIEVCTLGVSIPFLVRFSKLVNPNWTTTDVCVEHVLPATLKAQKAYYELDPNAKDENGNRVIGEANYFCSHAWKYKFVNVVDALELFCKNKGLKPEETFFWFDLFVNNQHKAPNLSYKWWCGRFKEAIRRFGKVVLVLEPWTDPIPIKRAWCLWEIFCTIDTGSEFNVAMCEEQHRSFKSCLTKKFDDIRTALSNIDARRADAWNKNDRDKIFAAIEKAIGFTKLNERVIEKMRDWLLSAGETHLSQTEEKLGKHALQTLETYNCLGKLYRDMNQCGKAEDYFKKALEGFIIRTGEHSSKSSQSMNNLAFSLQEQGKLVSAIEMHQKCLESRKKHFGELAKDTTQSMSNLATAFRMFGELAKAKEMFKHAVECREKLKKMGPDHPATLYTVSQYALTLSECKDFDLAKQQHQRAITGLHKFFNRLVHDGRKHPLTLMAIHNMGYHLMLVGEYRDSMEYLLEAYNGRLEKLGEDAARTIKTKELIDQVDAAMKDSIGRPRIRSFSAKTVETYLKKKQRRRNLWLKANNYLAFKDRLNVKMRIAFEYSEGDFEGGVTEEADSCGKDAFD